MSASRAGNVCTSCNGTGEVPAYPGEQDCSACGGTGQRAGSMTLRERHNYAWHRTKQVARRHWWKFLLGYTAGYVLALVVR